MWLDLCIGSRNPVLIFADTGVILSKNIGVLGVKLPISVKARRVKEVLPQKSE